MNTYLDALRDVLETGTRRDDRTGVGTISKFGMQQRYNLSKGFPAVTTKKLAWKSVVGELLWMIEGSVEMNVDWQRSHTALETV
jgi:thymidylate synthase